MRTATQAYDIPVIIICTQLYNIAWVYIFHCLTLVADFPCFITGELEIRSIMCAVFEASLSPVTYLGNLNVHVSICQIWDNLPRFSLHYE